MVCVRKVGWRWGRHIELGNFTRFGLLQQNRQPAHRRPGAGEFLGRIIFTWRLLPQFQFFENLILLGKHPPAVFGGMIVVAHEVKGAVDGESQ